MVDRAPDLARRFLPWLRPEDDRQGARQAWAPTAGRGRQDEPVSADRHSGNACLRARGKSLDRGRSPLTDDLRTRVLSAVRKGLAAPLDTPKSKKPVLQCYSADSAAEN